MKKTEKSLIKLLPDILLVLLIKTIAKLSILTHIGKNIAIKCFLFIYLYDLKYL